MANEVDISERWLIENYPKAFARLLEDHSTGENIYWATECYKERGEGFGFFDPITIDKIKDDTVILPRARKSVEEQTRRVKDKAEVFTPSWICNAQNNLVDDAWFGRKEVFNREIIHEDGTHDWEITERPIVFGKSHNKQKKCSWQQYIEDRRLEITCGEAPYLVSRYDPATGIEIPLFIENEAGEKIYKRIGMLDRKLQVVTQFETIPSKWMNRAHTALKAIYGFEWQGDSLLLAREAILISVIEYFKAAFPDEPGNLVNNQTFSKWVNNCAYFISWNIWQMDGLGFILPNTGKGIKVAQKSESDNNAQLDLFSTPTQEEVEKEIEDARARAPKILSLLRSTNLNTDTGIPAIVSDWNHTKDESRHVFFYSLINK